MTRAAAAEAEGASGWRTAVTLAILWLSGAALRLPVLSVPPIIPAIHRDLDLSEAGIGILTSLPTLMFAWAAIPGALLIARAGALRTLIAGLLLTAAASALRGAVTDIYALYAATLVMGFGISVMQPALPPLVRRWMPHRIGLGTSVYSNGWLVSEILAVWLTIPYVLPLVHGSWRWSLAVWSVPVLLTAIMLMIFAPRSSGHGDASLRRRWWPDWRHKLLWRLGFTMGGANIAYWASNAFIPDYLTHTGRVDLIGETLTALNVGQLPVSFLFLGLAGRLAGRSWPLAALGAVMLASVFGLVLTDGLWLEFSAGVVGFSCAGIMILVLTVPPLVGDAEDVPRITAGMFVIAYNCSVVVQILGGALWDATRSPYPAFGLIALGCTLTIVLPILSGRRIHAPEMDNRTAVGHY